VVLVTGVLMRISSPAGVKRAHRASVSVRSASLVFTLLAATAMSSAHADENDATWSSFANDELRERSIPALEDAPVTNAAAHTSNYSEPISPGVNAKRMVLYSAAIEASLSAATSGAARIFDYPADKIVHVIAGTLALTDEPTGVTHEFKAGEFVVVPKHWRGIWRVTDFRESAVVSKKIGASGRSAENPEYSSSQGTSLVRINAKVSPFRGEPPVFSKVIYARELCVRALRAPAGGEYQPRAKLDRFVHVLSGSVDLVEQGKRNGEMKAGDTFITTERFNGVWSLGKGFEGILVSSNGESCLE
jgi:uncharacterized cupin superfamily protein